MADPQSKYGLASAVPLPSGPLSVVADSPQDAGPGNHFGDVIGDALKNGPQRFMDFLSGHPIEELNKNAAAHGEAAKAAIKAGDYSTAFGHLLAGLIPGSGDEAVKAGEEFGSGNPSGGFGHAVLALAPFLAPELANRAAPVVNAAGAGIAAAAPDAAAGLGKIGVGELVAKVPGMELPARFGLQYPGLKQIRGSIPKGLEAFKAALDASKGRTVGPPSIAPTKTPATPVDPTAPPAPAVTPQLQATAAQGAAVQLTPEEEALAQHVISSTEPQSISSALSLPPAAGGARAPLQPPLARPTPPPTSSATIAEALRQQMLESGTLDPTKEAGAAPQPTGPVPQAPLDAGMQSLPAATRKPAADANYRAQMESGDGVPGAQAYEAAARANKVDPLVDHLSTKLQESGISADDAAILKNPQFKPHWAALSHDLGIKPPSPTTINAVIEELKKREQAAK